MEPRRKRAKALKLLQTTAEDFMRDDCITLAAALSYYTVFSIAPLLFLVVVLAGSIFGQGTVREELHGEIGYLIGPAAAAQVRTMIDAVSQRAEEGSLGVTVSIGILLFTATGVFVQLQAAVNRAWGVKPSPQRGNIKDFVLQRITSLGMILVVSFIMLVSLVISALITAAGGVFEPYLPEATSASVLQAANVVVSAMIFVLLFAAIFRFMPDARIAWRDVWLGAAVTAALFSIGKFAVGLYLGSANLGQTFGPAGALAVMMFWVYFSSIILLFGAEFTQVWATTYGKRIRARKGAVRVVREEREIPNSV